MKHLLYKTVCTKTGHFYIGIHSSENDDLWYLGSGVKLKEMIKIHGKGSFKRIELGIFASRSELELAETKAIRESWKHPLSLNVRTSSKGWFKERSDSEKNEIRKKISNSLKNSEKAKAAAKNKRAPINNWNASTKIKVAKTRRARAIDRWKCALSKVNFESIDTSKFGWVQKVAEQSGLKPQKVSRVVKELYPGIYENAFKRKRGVV